MHSQDRTLFFELERLTPQVLIAIYRRGFFPWYSEGEPIRCFNPAMRCILYPHKLHIASRTARYAHRFGYSSAIDSNFHAVIDHCAAAKRADQDGTWITPELRDCFCQLFDLGYAHSFEVYRTADESDHSDGRASILSPILCGGLYGLWIDDIFYGESMFHHSTHASLVAFANLCAFAQSRAIRVIDCQIPTSHLIAHGAERCPQDKFMRLLDITPIDKK